MRGALLFLSALLWSAAAHAQAPDPLHAAIVPYALFQEDVTEIRDGSMATPEALDVAVGRAARHSSTRLARGWLAYGALTAAQSPAFAQGVRARVRAAGRAPVLRQLRRDTTYARRRPPGAAEAIRLVLASAAADGARLDAAAVRMEAIARDPVTGTWPRQSETVRGERDTRLRATSREERTLAPELVQRVSAAPGAASPLTNAYAFGGVRFWDGLGLRPGPAPPDLPTLSARPARAQTLDRMLTLSALFIVGATQSEAARVEALFEDEPPRDCFEIAQLQLRQCVSVAYAPDEDAFCLARHGLRDPAACIGGLAQAP